MVVPSENERRGSRRSPAFCAVELSSASKRGRCGVTRNASGRGLLIVTPSRFGAGDQLELSVYVRDVTKTFAARVVRVDENDASSPETWRYRLAVELEDALPEDVLEGAAAAARDVSARFAPAKSA